MAIRSTKAWVVMAAAAVLLSACAHFHLEDCGEDGARVLGKDQPRIRSWQLRTVLGDEAAVARRFTDYAVMSAYAYVEDGYCGHPPKIDSATAGTLRILLSEGGWARVPAAELAGACEDDTGLFYHVWKRDRADGADVVIAFRGTWGGKDWWYGNSYWFRRLFTANHQYSRARDYARKVLEHFGADAGGRGIRFYTAGHSLGGGLAQAVLYELPEKIIQAYAFAPSSATGYVERTDKRPLGACACDLPPNEARIYRIYESYEILANLRIFHKLFFPPEPWINEIRFPYKSSFDLVGQHSMADLATALAEKRRSGEATPGTTPWYSSATAMCTDRFVQSQKTACAKNPNTRTCPVAGSR